MPAAAVIEINQESGGQQGRSNSPKSMKEAELWAGRGMAVLFGMGRRETADRAATTA